MFHNIKNYFFNKIIGLLQKKVNTNIGPSNNDNFSDDILANMENEVTQEDEDNFKKQVSRRDRVGVFATWICMFFFAGLGGYIVNFKTKSWVSFIPGIGQIYDIFFGHPIKSLFAILIGTGIGYVVAMLICKAIYSGAKQDQLNKAKIQNSDMNNNYSYTSNPNSTISGANNSIIASPNKSNNIIGNTDKKPDIMKILKHLYYNGKISKDVCKKTITYVQTLDDQSPMLDTLIEKLNKI